MSEGSSYPELAFQPGVQPGYRDFSTDYERKSFTAKDNIYKLSDFGYHYNSEGFRCDELRPSATDDLRIVFVGCSLTFGTGLPVQDTYSYRLVEMLRDEGLNVQHWNLAHGSTSIEFSVRTLYQFMPRLKPDLVVALFPTHARRECFIPHKATRVRHLVNYLPNWVRAHFDASPVEEFYSDENVLYSVASSYALFDTVNRAHRCDYLWENWSYLAALPEDVEPLIPPRMMERRLALPPPAELSAPPKARDLAHWGPKAHQIIADAIYERMTGTLELGHARKTLRRAGKL